MFTEFTYEEITGNPPPKIEFDDGDASFFQNRKVLITGAGGTIGSEIFLTLSGLPNVCVVALDHDENALHSLSLRASNAALFQDSNYILADIRDSISVENSIRKIQPDTIIHCAAVKHVSTLETAPREAVLTNVMGTDILLKASKSHGVRSFLNVSTDKAASPTSNLGKSKFVAERLVLFARETGFLGYTNVRFGNVFNSKGSVIETFVYQIVNGFPITITDKMAKRYFMHKSEASTLALKALVINAAPVHILKMENQVSVLAVAERLRAHFNSNSEIVYTGLRGGEKLEESLSFANEIVRSTRNPKIMAIDSHSAGIELNDYSSFSDEEEAQNFLNAHSV